LIPFSLAALFWLKIAADQNGFIPWQTAVCAATVLVALFLAAERALGETSLAKAFNGLRFAQRARPVRRELCIALALLAVLSTASSLLASTNIQGSAGPDAATRNQYSNQSQHTFGEPEEGQLEFVRALRQRFDEQSQGITSDARALVLGLSIGEDSGLSEKTAEAMQVLSLSHLTAVSGANCAIVLGGVLLLLKRFSISRMTRTAASLLALVSYVLVVGPQPSVLRSALMASIIILAFSSGRKIPPLVSLAWSVVLVVLFWPEMATNLGLALSVAATAAILVLAPKMFYTLKPKMPVWLAASLAVSLAAQLWCLPLLLQLQGGIPTYSVLANLMAEPLVAPVTTIGILGLVSAALGLPFTAILTWLASLPAQLIVETSSLATLPISTIWWPGGTVGVVSMVLFALAVSLLFGAKRRFALAALSAVGLFWSVSASSAAANYVSWPVANWQLAACDVGQGDGIVVRSGEAIAVVDVGKYPELIDNCLDRLKVKNINLLVLTHFDADHAAGLSGALKGRSVELAVVTPFVDERPLAQSSIGMLTDATDRVVEGECCMSGTLGESTWQIVGPETDARGAEDTNDASISMVFQLNGFDLFSFADLGERGQMRIVEYHPDLLQRRPGIPLIVKVSHHGSSDQYPELAESLRAEVALFSVGQNNSYGHPTSRTLRLFESAGARILRTDLHGSISVGVDGQNLVIGVTGRG
jgi:competence protein ComEC